MNEKELEKIFKALANKRRIVILKFLKRKGNASVGDVANVIKLSLPSTSKHLMILFNADLVEKEQKSLIVYYFLPKTKNSAVNKLLSIV